MILARILFSLTKFKKTIILLPKTLYIHTSNYIHQKEKRNENEKQKAKKQRKFIIYDHVYLQLDYKSAYYLFFLLFVSST